MKKTIIAVLSLFVILIFWFAYTDTSMTSSKVNALISAKLQIGDPPAKIESFLKKHNIRYTFDDFSKRYQCIIRDPSPYKPKGYHSIVIYVYVDDNKSYKSAVVRDSYTII